MTEPRILLLDIETAPNLAYVWGLFDQNVGLNQMESPTEVLCFAAKWLGDKSRPAFLSIHTEGREAMVEAAHALLDAADVVVHYNGRRFDIPHLNREFVTAGLTPPSPYQQIDLYSVIKARFRFPSHKLAYVSKALGLEGKAEHEGFDLWRKCMAGDDAAWRRMARYNRQDVALLEDLYRLLLPWIPSLPHRSLYDGSGCPACGEDTLQKRGVYRTKVSVFQRYYCRSCGSWSRANRRDSGTSVQQVS